jgi:hypothetical protein
MVSRASTAVAPPPVLRPDWETLAWLAFRWSKPPDFNACPASSSLHRFYVETDKPKFAWFWGSNQKTTAVILRAKSPNHSCRFWGPNRKTRPTGFDVKPEKTVRVVLRPNHSQTVALGFEAQSRNPRSLSPRAQCRPHTAPPDLSIILPPSTRPVRPSLVLCILSRSLLLHAMPHLPPTHHETSKRDSPTKQGIKVKQPKYLGF